MMVTPNEESDLRSEAASLERQAEFDAAARTFTRATERALFQRIGLIDEELSERTGQFLAGERWLTDRGLMLTDTMLLLIAKAVGTSNGK
jgi:hypothetical protein